VSNERTRIAREIHDVVAHGLSIMIVQADGGLYAADQSPEQAKKALATIGDTGRASVRDAQDARPPQADEQPELDPNQPRPQPGVSSLPELIDNVRDAGLAVDYQVSGQPRDLPALLGSRRTGSCRRADQHAETRRARSAHVRRSGLRSRDADRGGYRRRPGAGVAPSSDPGHGLVGMRQRASISAVGERRTEGGRRLRGDRQAPVHLPPGGQT